MKLGDLFKEFQKLGVLTEIFGASDSGITRISPFETCQPGDLVFADKKEYLPFVQRGNPTAVITTAALKNIFGELKDLVVITAPNVALAHALIKQKYADRNYAETGWSGVHSTAVIHETAKVDSSTVVEPRAVIGRNTIIGKNCRIMAGVVIENDVKIGDNTIIQPNAIIGYGSQIGKNVLIGAGSSIGSEGYGFAQDQKRKSHTIPQTGIVILEDRVRIGNNCCIDRATYENTKIGAGTKMDNLCHIAHNVQIGEDCLLTAMCCIAGSTKIGNRVITSGQTGIIDHMNIADDVTLVHRAGVAQDIPTAGIYAGYPAQPLTDYMRNNVVLKNAVELKKRVQEIEKKLDIKKD